MHFTINTKKINRMMVILEKKNNCIRCATKFPLFFFIKIQLYCAKMVTNESFKVLPTLVTTFAHHSGRVQIPLR